MTQNDFTILRTNHTSFTVSDLDQTIDFFCDGLGFELLSRAPRDPKIIQQVTGVAGAEMEIAGGMANVHQHSAIIGIGECFGRLAFCVQLATTATTGMSNDVALTQLIEQLFCFQHRRVWEGSQVDHDG